MWCAIGRVINPVVLDKDILSTRIHTKIWQIQAIKSAENFIAITQAVAVSIWISCACTKRCFNAIRQSIIVVVDVAAFIKAIGEYRLPSGRRGEKVECKYS